VFVVPADNFAPEADRKHLERFPDC
jgi:hypothetical protein